MSLDRAVEARAPALAPSPSLCEKVGSCEHFEATMIKRLLCSCLLIVSSACTGYVVPAMDFELEPSATAQTGTSSLPKKIRYAGDTGVLNATIGIRSQTESSQWTPLEDQVAGGLDFTFLYPNSPVGLSTAIHGAYARESQTVGAVSRSVDAFQGEISVGPKAFIDLGSLPMQLYLGAGASFVYVQVDGVSGLTTRSSDDFVIGAYAQVGLMVQLNQKQGIGLEYRGLRGGSANLFGGDRDIDYDQFSVVFSTGF